MKTRVLVVDDSALMRSLLQAIVNAEPDMEAVGAAADPIAARELIRSRDPDVITLDVEMPRMDGIEFLERLMRLRPTPVVMVSSLTERGADATLRALELGAVDFVAKPKVGVAEGIRAVAADIAEKIRSAARSRVRRRSGGVPAPRAESGLRFAGTEKLIFIGASTGGTEAIRAVLSEFPADAPGTLITQHMPPGFTASFARRLDELCRIRVKEAVNGERVVPGHAYIAPGDRHLLLHRSGASYVTELSDAPPVNRHKPSVEVLFRAAARCVGRNALGIMLSGMGKDGAQAMREMHEAGAHTIAQDEASCVVFGMPREAIAAGAVDDVLPLEEIAARALHRLAAG